jgi:hypothetical protein
MWASSALRIAGSNGFGRPPTSACALAASTRSSGAGSQQEVQEVVHLLVAGRRDAGDERLNALALARAEQLTDVDRPSLRAEARASKLSSAKAMARECESLLWQVARFGMVKDEICYLSHLAAELTAE